MGTKTVASISLFLAAIAAGGVMLHGQAGMQIAPRDMLNITVSGHEDLTKKVVVDVDGSFDYPYLGRVKAAGLTTRDVAADLKKRLNPDYAVNPTVVVELEQTISKRFSILGEVRSPGNVPFAGELRLLEALARAGSVTDTASDELLIFHSANYSAESSTPVRIDLYELLSGSEAGQRNNVIVQDGDTINVLKAKPVYVQGYVKSVGAYPVHRGMTVSEVLVLAGGVNEKGKTSGIKIERSDANGKKLPDIVVKDIKTEIVRPGDTVRVPARIW